MATKTTPRAKPKPKPTPWPILTAQEMADLCGFSQEMLRRIERAGAFSKSGKDKYSPPDVFKGVLAYMRDEARRTSKTAEAAAVHRARAREIELRIAKEEGRLIETEAAEAVFADVLGTWRTELAGLSAAVTRDLTQRKKIDDFIEAAVARARAKFAAERDRITKGAK